MRGTDLAVDPTPGPVGVSAPAPTRWKRAALILALALVATPAKASPSGDLGDAAALDLAFACASPRPYIVAVQQRGRLAPWFDPSEFEQRLRAGLPDQSQVGAVANGYIDTADDAAVRGTLSLANGALVVADLSPAEDRVDVFLTGHCFPAPRSERALPGDLLVSWQPPAADQGETGEVSQKTSDTDPLEQRAVASNTLPRLRMRNLDTIRARVPSCSAALHDYETSRHGIVISAVLGTLGVGIMTAGISAGADPAAGGGLTLAMFGTLMPYLSISAGPKADAKECVVDAGYRLGR